jgi:ankyrin repeat protein
LFHRAARDLDLDTITHVIELIENQKTTGSATKGRIMEQLSEVITAKDLNGLTPFHLACIPNQEEDYNTNEIIGKKKGSGLPPINSRSLGKQKNNDLREKDDDITTKSLKLKVLEILYKYGDKIKSANNKVTSIELSRDLKTGWNIVHWLAFNNDLDCLNFLKQVNFLNFGVPNIEGNFPIDIAGGNGNREIINFFLLNYQF